jgi:hypothetical protein
MITSENKIPNGSIIKNEESSFDYIDSYQGVFQDKSQQADLAKVLKLFISTGPKWAGTLMSIRDKVVKPFGLSTSEPATDKQIKHVNYEIGEQAGIFKILDKADNEIIMGQDDKHLNFKVSILLEAIANDTDKKKLSITTAVKFNNILGKLYFLPVKPFHRLIVRDSLKNIIRRIENEDAV